eukprot:5259068-Pyramimonas_sp.AAC.1
MDPVTQRMILGNVRGSLGGFLAASRGDLAHQSGGRAQGGGRETLTIDAGDFRGRRWNILCVAIK